jgi:hypothetical protein
MDFTPAANFQPAAPHDHEAIVKLFSLAARAACAAPQDVLAISAALQRAIGHLVPPEVYAAEQCLKLWKAFARSIEEDPKRPGNRGQALHRELDALGQVLDIAPLPAWAELPEETTSPQFLEDAVTVPNAMNIAEARDQARRRARKKKQPALAAETVLRILRGVDPRLLSSLLEHARQGDDSLAGSDVNLVARFVMKGQEIEPKSDALTSALERIGAWMIRT